MRRYWITVLTVFAVIPAPGCSWYEAMTRKLGIHAYDGTDAKQISRAEAESLEVREPD